VADVDYLQITDHEEIRQRLARAVEQGRLPQSLLLYGPRGVGKQRLGLWTAAALTCQAPAAPRPCGACHSCRLARRLQHPDIHWFFPLPRPKRASGHDQLRQKLEDQRAAALAERRANRFYLHDHEGPTGIYVGAVHTMRGLAQRSPAMGPAKILVIGRAEAMTPQLGNPEAANALLKLLEEPPDDTWLILTCEVPGALLPTIRSRLQAVRVAPLSTERVASFLADEIGLPTADAQRLAVISGGSIGKALELQDEDLEDQRESAVELARAALAQPLVDPLAVAHRYRAFGARGTFNRALAGARELLRELLALAVGADVAAAQSSAVTRLARATSTDPTAIIRALAAVGEARELAERNVNPQLIVANLPRLGGVDALISSDPGRKEAR
jgi:DNA polymerase-3 subunit delta'